MSVRTPKLILLSGKIASGKSSLAQKLADECSAILISQDEWLSSLYPGEISSLEDYVRCFGRLSAVMGRHVSQILKAGHSVVLDFPANTIRSRAWMKEIGATANCSIELHFLDVPDEVCLERLKLRNQSGVHEYKASEEVFRQFTSYFVAPSTDEGIEIVVHAPVSGG